MLRSLLSFHVDRLVTVQRVSDRRQVKPLRIGGRKARVPIAIPLHGSAHAVAVPEVDVVAHPDLVTVIDNWAAW